MTTVSFGGALNDPPMTTTSGASRMVNTATK